jgi:HAE1 family hydrophobic/amphiphilic exporter-1
MNFFKSIIKRPVTVLMVIIIIMVFGAISILNIRQSLLPDITMPKIMIITEYAGAGPEEVEKLVSKPIEEIVSTIPDFVNATSTSSYGSSLVTVEVSSDANINFASLKVREKLSMIEKLLPSGASKSLVMEFDTNNMPVMATALVSDGNFTEFSNLVKNSITKKLESVPGAASVTVQGSNEDQIMINIKKDKLDGYGITLSQLTNIIRQESATLPGGKITEGTDNYIIKTNAEINSLEQVKDIILQNKFGSVSLSELADITIAPKDPDYNINVNGKKAIYFVVFKQPETNTLKLSDNLTKELETIKKDYTGLDYTVVFDQAESIRKSIKSLLDSGWQGSLLAILVLLVFLKNIRSTLVISCAIPISIVSTFVLMYLNKMTFNTMSLAGLVLGVGMLVDNSVVVLENIFRHMELGESRFNAAVKGTKEVAGAVTASTLTTIVVFLPLFFIKGNMSVIMFKEVGFTIIFSLLASLVVALTFVPVLAAKILKLNNEKKKREGKIIRKYRELITYCFNNKWKVVIAMSTAFVISLAAIPLLGAELFPDTDSGSIDITVKLPKGTSLYETTKTGEEILNISLKEVGDRVKIKHYLSSFGASGAGFARSSDSSAGIIKIVLEDRKHRKYSTKELSEFIRKATLNLAGVDINLDPVDITAQMMGSGGGTVGINIYGEEFSELSELSEKCESFLKGLNGVRDVKISIDEVASEYSIEINRQKASMYGISARAIAETIQTAFLGTNSGGIKIDGNEYKTIVKYDEKYSNTKEDLKNIMIVSQAGVKIPLSELAEIKNIKSPISINRDGMKRIVTVTGIPYGRTPGDINSDIEKFIKTIPVDNGYKLSSGNGAQEMAESMYSLVLMLIIAVLLVYMVMAAEFESLIHPFAVLFSIPVAMIGVVILLFAFRMAFSVPVFIGVITLAGVVVNNAIVLIDYSNQLRAEGKPIIDSLIEAGTTRLRPIFITAITTVLGLVPMAISQGEGAETMQPFAVTVIGGLSFSTVLTLLYVPCIYLILEGWKERIIKKFSKEKEMIEV